MGPTKTRSRRCLLRRRPPPPPPCWPLPLLLKKRVWLEGCGFGASACAPGAEAAPAGSGPAAHSVRSPGRLPRACSSACGGAGDVRPVLGRLPRMGGLCLGRVIGRGLRLVLLCCHACTSWCDELEGSGSCFLIGPAGSACGPCGEGGDWPVFRESGTDIRQLRAQHAGCDPTHGLGKDWVRCENVLGSSPAVGWPHGPPKEAGGTQPNAAPINGTYLNCRLILVQPSQPGVSALTADERRRATPGDDT